MALVLTTVLVWYTIVVPPYAPAPRRAWSPSDDEGADGEVRDADAAKSRNLELGISSLKSSPEAPAEELDWPEYICLD